MFSVLHISVSQLYTLNQSLLDSCFLLDYCQYSLSVFTDLTYQLVSFKLFLAQKTGPVMDMYYVMDGSRHDSQ